KSAETFAIAFEDAFQRLNAAAEAKDLVKSLSTDLRNWAATSGATPADLARMAKAVRTLADTKGPQYYDEPYWYERGHVLSWRKARASIDSGHALKDVA